jgi:hypothetical protein
MNIIKPPKERTSAPKYSAHTNRPVNYDKVLTVCAGREAYYPDNEGIPVIEFWFGGENKHQWYFDKGEDKLRDKLLAQLLEDVK